MNPYLFLVRHGKSEWNELGLWTGWTDVSLHPDGILEARKAGELLQSFSIERAHVSALKRAQETLNEIQRILKQDFSVTIDAALNERNYGVYTGKNKWQVKDMLGERTFEAIRRGWDTQIPKGESLKAVYERTVPYFKANIIPELYAGKNVLVVAHGNTLRSLMKHIEEIPDDKIHLVEVGCGEVVRYSLKGDTLKRE